MNWKRWALVGYLVVLMAFTALVLLIPGEKYDTLTTSDSGWFYGIAREYDNANGVVLKYSLSHAPGGFPVPTANQAQPLLAVMLHRAVSAVRPSTSLMDVVRYWSPLIFALTIIPIFLIGRELAGDFAGCAAAFFFAVLGNAFSYMSGPNYWMKIGAFDHDTLDLILTAWTIFLIIKLFRAPRKSIPVYAVLTGLVYGLFGLSWGVGAFYLSPIVVGGLLLALLFGFVGRWIRKSGDVFGALISALRDNLHLILGVVGMLIVFTFVLGAFGGFGPAIWVDFTRTLLSYIGLGGGGGGVSLGTVAGEEAPPNSWGDTINSFYAIDILTTLVFFFIILGMIKICWSRKRWELLVFPWLFVIAMMVMPGRGQVRFMRMWWPFVPVLAGVGAAFLITLIGRLSRESMTSSWVEPLQKPAVIAICICVIATPFVLNSCAAAEVARPPTESYTGMDAALLGACKWLRENTPENSIVAIEWSYGHVLTGVSERASVCDGVQNWGEEGKWENAPSFTPSASGYVYPPPPDYIYYVRDSTGYIYGRDVSAREYQINGRRIDVQRFPLMGEKEFEWILSTYRDNYGCKIDYVIFDLLEASSAQNYYYNSQPANILWNAERIKTQLQSWDTEAQNYVFNFGENRENIVLDMQTRGNVYLRTENENLYIDGYGVLFVSEAGNISFGGFFPPPSTVDLSETLLVFLDENNNIISAWLIEGVSAEIAARPVPVDVLVFAGLTGNIGYLEDVFTSSNDLVKILKINHLPLLTSPADATVTSDATPAFQWSRAVGAASYELWVDNDTDFSSPEIRENISTTTYTPTTELVDGTYSWRVMAFRADNTELGWSPTWGFVVDTVPPTAAVLYAPENGITTSDNTPTFEWTIGTNATKHRLLVDNDGDFSSPEVDVALNMPENTHTPSELVAENYWWKVIAIDDANNESESPAWEFTVQI